MITQYWWNVSGDEKARILHAYIKALDQNQAGIQQNNLRNMRLYSNQEVTGLSIANYVLQNATGTASARGGRLTLNVVKSSIDTLVSKVCKNKIAPTFLTQNAPYSLQQQAKKMTLWTKGLFYQAKIHENNPMIFRDACIFGTGISKCYSEIPSQKGKKAKICFDRIFPDELIVDVNDAYYGNPMSIAHRRFVSKEFLRGAFPKNLAQINAAETINLYQQGTASECCLLIEAWRLPDTATGKGGQHVLGINTVNFVDDDWNRDHFPFAIMAYTKPLLGFFGTGVSEDLMGIQLEINRILIHIQKSMSLLGNPRVYIESGSSVNTNQLTNEVGGIVKYTGQAPIIQTAQTVHPEMFNQLNSLYQRAYEIIGVSQLSSQSKNVLGANASGAAFREFSDIETERFADIQYGYQSLHLEQARLGIEEAKWLKEQGHDVESVAFDRKSGTEKIKWSEIDLDESAYVMQVFPASALPSQPGARLQTVTEMQQAGWIDPETAQDLADLPDLDNNVRIQTAPLRMLRKRLELILADSQYRGPEPYDNLDLGLKLAVFYLADASERDAPEESLNLLRQYIDDSNALKAQASQPAPQTAAPAQQLLDSQLSATPQAQAAPGMALPPTLQ